MSTRCACKLTLALLFCSLGLGGCVGSAMTSARSAGPSKVLASQKPAQRVAECVEYSWQSEPMFGIDANAYLHAGKDGVFTVYTREAAYFVDVRAQGTGAALDFYGPAQPSPVTDTRLAAVATCL
ncbi:hypothetical protein SFA35_16945 [Pseudomonas sp. HR96]|uniref:hypothetical protein n=1 Tax=Pseudomonas sp. HR96 TaxID=1027966 RepID=UPI002A757F88|nr:hypothetical protein [Pseudomonas sp. HR96]WPO98325.1 hypothetical protein SFA35_16945 [Pseudomonas sp. HR96]